MIFYTSICSNYLPKAMALAESIKHHCKSAKFVLCLVEREAPDVAKAFPHFDEVILSKDAGWDNFDQYMFRHSIVEASTAVKPRFMLHLMERFADETKFVYLDPDVLVYGDLVELADKLDTETIVLCPHLLRPGNIDMEMSSLAHGTYNLGFLAVARSDNATRFVTWWAERLFLYCYDDKVRGIFTDQKWIDLVPSFFDAHIFKHHGYDFATWSLLGSDLREDAQGNYIVNGDPLRFIHFSGLDSGMIDRAIDWWLTDDNSATFKKLYAEYLSLLERHGQSTLGRTPWTYANYDSGTPISKRARVAYRNQALWAAHPAPFSEDDIAIAGPETAATQAAQRNGIPERFARSILNFGLGATMKKAARAVVAKGVGLR